MFIITIDGPASSGKSTVAHIVAQKLNIAHINSGEAYRAIAYYMLNSGIAPTDTERVIKGLNNVTFKMVYEQGKQAVYINKSDVTSHLHTNQINVVVSQYAEIPEVIYKASDMARDVAKNISVVMEGRNLGSFCFPEAEHKFYIDCAVEERAKRRLNEMLQKSEDVNYEMIYNQILSRDNSDKTRKIAPLKVPEHAVLLDSTNLTAEQVADKIVEIVTNNQKVIG